MDRRSGLDRRSLTGAQRAAALLIVMGRDSATRLLKHLDADEIKDITRAAATLGLVDAGSLMALIDRFADEVAEGPPLVGDLNEAKTLASGALPPEDVSRILADFSGRPKVDVWAELRASPESRILKLIEGEPSQIAGLVMAKADPALAARVFALLPDDARSNILARMLETRPLTPFMAGRVEEALGAVVSTPLPMEQGEKPQARIAEIVNRMDPAEIDGVLDGLAVASPGRVDEVRALIFKFDDIVRLSPTARTTLFDQVSTERVVLALKGTEEDLRAAVVACLGARARRMVEAELASGQASPARDIAAARRSIAETALRLAETGAIELPGATGLDPATEP